MSLTLTKLSSLGRSKGMTSLELNKGWNFIFIVCPYWSNWVHISIVMCWLQSVWSYQKHTSANSFLTSKLWWRSSLPKQKPWKLTSMTLSSYRTDGSVGGRWPSHSSIIIHGSSKSRCSDDMGISMSRVVFQEAKEPISSHVTSQPHRKESSSVRDWASWGSLGPANGNPLVEENLCWGESISTLEDTPPWPRNEF